MPAGQPWRLRPGVAAAGRGGLGAQPLLPRGRDLRRQVQAANAGVVVLEVGPEVPPELLGQGVQAPVVQGGLAFLQVVDQQVTDRAAGQLVAVDQLGRAALPDGQQLGQRGWRVRAEGTALPKQPP
jgi:hypothetical protein